MELEARGEVSAAAAGALRTSLSLRMLFALMLCLVSDLSMQREVRVVRVDRRPPARVVSASQPKSAQQGVNAAPATESPASARARR